MVAQVIQNQIERIDGQKKIFWMLLSLSILFIILYGFFIEKTIMNSVAKQNYEKQLSALTDKVNDLDSNYIELEKNVTLEVALSKGFINVNNQEVAYTKVVDTGLSLNKN